MTRTIRISDDTYKHLIYAKAVAEKGFIQDLSINEVIHSLTLHVENEDKKGLDIKCLFEQHYDTKATKLQEGFKY